MQRSKTCHPKRQTFTERKRSDGCWIVYARSFTIDNRDYNVIYAAFKDMSSKEANIHRKEKK